MRQRGIPAILARLEEQRRMAAVRQEQERALALRQRQVVVPEQPAERPADNEPPTCIEIVSMLFEELRNTISEWLRRIFFGG
jgi:hypothetical protein